MTRLFFLILAAAIAWESACAQSTTPPKRQFRGAWIATISNVDWPSRPGLSPEEQQRQLITRFDQLQAMGCNAVIFQVRPVADAFYESSYEPWSRFLSGKTGGHPGYDPLRVAVDEAHRRGMELHAWFNPFRALTDAGKNPNPPGHVTRTHPEWTVTYGGKTYLDPGAPEARAYSIAVITECARRYDIDAVHMDDYFYPYKVGGLEFGDGRSFLKHAGGYLTRADWRRANVNAFVQALADSLQRVKPYLKFGISPFGVWRSNVKDPVRGSPTPRTTTNYDDLYADILLWLEKGWIDYAMPQLYWEHGHRAAPFEVLFPWWQQWGYGKHIYYGLGAYRMTGAPPAVWTGTRELLRQIDAVNAARSPSGWCLYSTASFDKISAPIDDSLRARAARSAALIPPMPWIDSVAPAAPAKLSTRGEGAGIRLRWEPPRGGTGPADAAARYAVYRFPEGEAVNTARADRIIAVGPKPEYFDAAPGRPPRCTYAVTALDRTWNESAPAAVRVE